ncbi:hypothetical protein BRADI_3g14781v3 [Brachypodium distachyon]|uniref:Uncharacterized protein n=1 Tax=Brachypodium distachyon TaxID=15368 RepID=A0A2K2CX54_BRADI|nr:hypothetical protein BRADI_3g14781v3 [Brachypodium distachyon]
MRILCGGSGSGDLTIERLRGDERLRQLLRGERFHRLVRGGCYAVAVRGFSCDLMTPLNSSDCYAMAVRLALID